MNAIRRLLAVSLALFTLPVQAAFHLWAMNEVYSNEDGTVQFLELTAITGGQQFMAGHRLATSGSINGPRTFTFPNDLPGDTAGRTMLIGTQGFAALGVVSPDYVVPNGFFPREGGTIDFAESADVWTYGALPLDLRSLMRNPPGTLATNSPRNFAGVSGTVTAPAPAALNVQGLWYKSPAESEAGWGLNIAHQGDILFITWFTYDLDGSQMWLVGSRVEKIDANTYAGVLYRTTGPPFNATPFTPITAANLTEVGRATLSFTDASNGTFQYTVNGTMQSKAITRQVFGPMPTCTTGGAAGNPPNFQDLWYASPAESEAGWGLNVTHQGDIIFMTWFTYDLNGRGMWIVGSRMERSGTSSAFSGPLYRTTGPAFNSVPFTPITAANLTQVGTGTLTFNSASAGTFNYTVNGVTQTKNLVKQVFGPATVCR